MFDTGLPPYINLLVSVLSLTVLAGVAYVGFKASFNSARIKALREDNDDLRHRVDDCDKELDKVKAARESDKATMAAQASEITLLREMVLQRAEVERTRLALEARLDEIVRLVSP